MPIQYYPIFSGGLSVNPTNTAWSTIDSSMLTDMNTGAGIATGLRFQCLKVQNIGSVGVVVTWGQTAAIVTATSTANSLRVAPGEAKTFEVLSLGSAIGVEFAGVQSDPALLDANLGDVNTAKVIVFGEFGNT
jgi:hypothetical protein